MFRHIGCALFVNLQLQLSNFNDVVFTLHINNTCLSTDPLVGAIAIHMIHTMYRYVRNRTYVGQSVGQKTAKQA